MAQGSPTHRLPRATRQMATHGAVRSSGFALNLQAMIGIYEYVVEHARYQSGELLRRSAGKALCGAEVKGTEAEGGGWGGDGAGIRWCTGAQGDELESKRSSGLPAGIPPATKTDRLDATRRKANHGPIERARQALRQACARILFEVHE